MGCCQPKGKSNSNLEEKLSDNSSDYKSAQPTDRRDTIYLRESDETIDVTAETTPEEIPDTPEIIPEQTPDATRNPLKKRKLSAKEYIKEVARRRSIKTKNKEKTRTERSMLKPRSTLNFEQADDPNPPMPENASSPRMSNYAVDDWLRSPSEPVGWTPSLQPKDFERVYAIWSMINRENLVIPMCDSMYEKLFTKYPACKHTLMYLDPEVIFASKTISQSNQSSKTNTSQNMEGYLISHTMAFWRSMCFLVKNRRESWKGVQMLSELYTFHHKIFMKTGVPSREHFQRFLSAMDEYLVMHLSESYNGQRRASFQEFLIGVYYFITRSNPDAQEWCRSSF